MYSLKPDSESSLRSFKTGFGIELLDRKVSELESEMNLAESGISGFSKGNPLIAKPNFTESLFATCMHAKAASVGGQNIARSAVKFQASYRDIYCIIDSTYLSLWLLVSTKCTKEFTFSGQVSSFSPPSTNSNGITFLRGKKSRLAH